MDNTQKILIVDDSEDVRFTLAGVLSDDGYFVKTTASDTEAISILQEDSFQFVVIDINLQGDDDASGVELAKKIRDAEINSKIVFITGQRVRSEYIKSVIEYGIIDFIQKKSGWIDDVQNAIDIRSNKFDVFLCHNSEDKPTIKKIGQELKQRGLQPWLDEWELTPGLPWQSSLESQIENINATAVFVGSSGIGPWQQMELEGLLKEFVNRNIPVIPVLLENAPSRVQLPVFLRGMTWVDFRRETPDPMKQLIWGITGVKQDATEDLSEKKEVPLAQEGEEILSLPLKPANLHDVFCTTGLPDFTYVEPEIFRDVWNDILQPGKHVLIIGPSGSGKTCLLTRILDGLNWIEDDDYLLISALDDDSDEQVENILDETLSGTVTKPIILDDFHVLDIRTRSSLGTKLKQLSDKVFQKNQVVSTFILLGISTSPQSLLYSASDLGRRLGIYRMPLPKSSDLHTLIQRGERKLTIEFSNRDKIIEDSANSFFICQYLCRRICIDSQVSRTMDSLTVLNYRIEDIRRHLVQQLSEQFKPFLVSFVQNSGTKEQWLPFLAIIASISSSPNFQFTLAEIVSRCGDLGVAISAAKDKISQAIFSYGLDGRMGKILYYEESTGLLSIEDPIFRYYLNHINITEFIQSLGISSKERDKILDIFETSGVSIIRQEDVQRIESPRTDIFISYSHKDRQWLDLLQTHLRPLVRNKEISLWVDTQIQAGMKWRTEIDKAIASAKVAILLVSPEFLASDFIAENELPPLLTTAEQDGLRIIWIPISYCLYTETNIVEFQAAHDPSSPLDLLSQAERNKVLVDISLKIRDAFNDV